MVVKGTSQLASMNRTTKEHSNQRDGHSGRPQGEGKVRTLDEETGNEKAREGTHRGIGSRQLLHNPPGPCSVTSGTQPPLAYPSCDERYGRMLGRG